MCLGRKTFAVQSLAVREGDVQRLPADHSDVSNVDDVLLFGKSFSWVLFRDAEKLVKTNQFVKCSSTNKRPTGCSE